MTRSGCITGQARLTVCSAAALSLLVIGCSSGRDAQNVGETAGSGGSPVSGLGGSTSGGSSAIGGGGAAAENGGNGAVAEDGGSSASGGGSPGVAGSAGSSGSGGTSSAPGPKVAVDASGKYTVTFTRPPWVFGGSLGAPATAIATTTGSDAAGAYHETTFTYSNSGTRNARIRSYDGASVVVFAETNPASGSNIRNFPKLSTLPSTSYHLTHQDVQFAPYTFSGLTGDSPWLFFDGSANAFILSAGSHFMNAQTSRDGSGTIAVGISSQIATLPAGFEQTAVLAADAGINRTWDDWGATLMKLGGIRRRSGSRSRSRPAAPPRRFGCISDSGRRSLELVAIAAFGWIRHRVHEQMPLDIECPGSVRIPLDHHASFGHRLGKTSQIDQRATDDPAALGRVRARRKARIAFQREAERCGGIRLADRVQPLHDRGLEIGRSGRDDRLHRDCGHATLGRWRSR